MPTNLYGPGDNFDLENSRVLPALVRKFHEARKSGADEVVVRGSGKPLREFLHVDDMADACVFAMENIGADDVYGKGISRLNAGAGKDISIAELALAIKEAVGFEGRITHDTRKPDGMFRKLSDEGRLEKFGWKCGIGLRQGIRDVYGWYCSNVEQPPGKTTGIE